jgi:hypothetical protein
MLLVGRPFAAQPEEVSMAHPNDQDEGLGNIGPGEQSSLSPDDEGLGNVRPEDLEPPSPDEAGIGNVSIHDQTGLGPEDEGLGNLRGDQPSHTP